MPADVFREWYQALSARYLQNLTLSEVRRGIQALSTIYIHKRQKLNPSSAKSVFKGEGKKAAFALFYGPLHFLIIEHLMQQLLQREKVKKPILPEIIIDCGAGTGVGSLAVVSAYRKYQANYSPEILAIDKNAWALKEAKTNFQIFKIWPYTTLVEDFLALKILNKMQHSLDSQKNVLYLFAFSVNELSQEKRAEFLKKLSDFIKQSKSLKKKQKSFLIIEPIAKSLTPFFADFAKTLGDLGFVEDVWRFNTREVKLPQELRTLDHSAHLDHSELTAKTLYFS